MKSISTQRVHSLKNVNINNAQLIPRKYVNLQLFNQHIRKLKLLFSNQMIVFSVIVEFLFYFTMWVRSIRFYINMNNA